MSTLSGLIGNLFEWSDPALHQRPEIAKKCAELGIELCGAMEHEFRLNVDFINKQIKPPSAVISAEQSEAFERILLDSLKRDKDGV